jgi:hypothetical protein
VVYADALLVMAVTVAPPLTCKRNNTKQPSTTAHVEIDRCLSSDGDALEL